MKTLRVALLASLAALLIFVPSTPAKASAYFSCKYLVEVEAISKKAKAKKTQLVLKVLQRTGGDRCLMPAKPGMSLKAATVLSKQHKTQIKVGTHIKVSRYKVYPTPRRGIKIRVYTGWRIIELCKQTRCGIKRPTPAKKALKQKK